MGKSIVDGDFPQQTVKLPDSTISNRKFLVKNLANLVENLDPICNHISWLTLKLYMQ